MTSDYFLGSLLSLSIVLGLILLLSWFLKRFYKPIAEKKNALLKIQASISVGPHEKVVLLKVAEQWLVLGVTSSQVNTLLTLPADAFSESDLNLSNQTELAKYWWEYYKNASL
jgi:flagellar protein FliO/FliZ